MLTVAGDNEFPSLILALDKYFVRLQPLPFPLRIIALLDVFALGLEKLFAVISSCLQKDSLMWCEGDNVKGCK